MQSPNFESHIRAVAAGERDTSDMPAGMPSFGAETLQKRRVRLDRSGLEHISRVQDSASAESSADSPFCSPPFQSIGIHKQTH